MKINRDDVNHKTTYVRFAVGVLLFLAFALQACSSLSATQDMPARATWTPVAHPTDQPYRAKEEVLSYFGETPAIVIFGSQDPESDSPLQAINLSTEDVYDVAALTPGPISTWSRPIMSADKELFFQIGPKLYKLLPGGDVTAIDLPFDEENPIFCNWSWQGQVVCLNGLMTEGYLVDRDLEIVEMPLPDYAPADDTVAFYPPYRVGENVLRIVQKTTSRAGSQVVINYKELDLETLSVADRQERFDFDFNRKMMPPYTVQQDEFDLYAQAEGDLDVIGMTDSGDKAVLQSTLQKRNEEGQITTSIAWVELFDQQAEFPEYLGEFPINVDNPEKSFYQNHFITVWLYFEQETPVPRFPGVYDLETGLLLFDSTNVFGNTRMPAVILPYGDDWLAGCYYGLGFVDGGGHFLKTEYFPIEIIETYGDVERYVVTQPMEP